MPRVRINLLTNPTDPQTNEATRLPPIEFDIEIQHVLPFMQSLERLTKTPDLLIASIVAMDNAVKLTRQEAEHP